jgi:hypothetical protein
MSISDGLYMPYDESIYQKCKLYFEKYICIKNTLKHNANIIQNMKIKNKILKMKNKQLEKELQSLLLNYEYNKNFSEYLQIKSDNESEKLSHVSSHISLDDYEMLEV